MVMDDTIRTALISCFKFFDELVGRVKESDHGGEVPPASWTDELGRLRVWGR